MKKMEKEYQDLKKKEQEEMAELRRLRRENCLLKQRNELLEAESAELADRLVRGQVSRAEEEETRTYPSTAYSDLESRMKDELMNVKIKFTEQSQTVAELKQEISRLETKYPTPITSPDTEPWKWIS
ncbi:GM13070 [Drosophila sechellia]|uniref:GM13070 n=1 Tax=Drosophila sechellia TaxID=7238 RepID=B4IK14_DROSE|nr:GM13070 [Drosophila sechellia]